MLRFAAVLLLAAAFLTRAAGEEEARPAGWLHLNGYTHHFDAPGANDELWGLGWTWYHRRWTRVMEAWEADAFRDSECKFAAYVGHSWTYRWEHVHAGITGAIMYHRNFAKQNRWRLLPVGLPFVELPVGRASLRAYYIPPVRSPCDQQISFQLLIPLLR